jgi:hypothetical protein
MEADLPYTPADPEVDELLNANIILIPVPYLDNSLLWHTLKVSHQRNKSLSLRLPWRQ